jgi:hypothetical protein
MNASVLGLLGATICIHHNKSIMSRIGIVIGDHGGSSTGSANLTKIVGPRLYTTRDPLTLNVLRHVMIRLLDTMRSSNTAGRCAFKGVQHQTGNLLPRW